MHEIATLKFASYTRRHIIKNKPRIHTCIYNGGEVRVHPGA